LEDSEKNGDKDNLPDNEEPDLSLSMNQGGLEIGSKTYQGLCRGGDSSIKWELAVLFRGAYQLNYGQENPSLKKAFSGKYFSHKTTTQIDLLFYDQSNNDVFMQCNGVIKKDAPPEEIVCSVVKEDFEFCRGINLKL
jgi:hypothetical protein